jgi:hypothetical protein
MTIDKRRQTRQNIFWNSRISNDFANGKPTAMSQSNDPAVPLSRQAKRKAAIPQNMIATLHRQSGTDAGRFAANQQPRFLGPE